MAWALVFGKAKEHYEIIVPLMGLKSSLSVHLLVSSLFGDNQMGENGCSLLFI